jgi:hypothetical protein
MIPEYLLVSIEQGEGRVPEQSEEILEQIMGGTEEPG